MKKTISVNIKGIHFILEEDAYELLQDYLGNLELTLGGKQGSNEIIEDIELRIAELCNAKINDQKSVIELNDIELILATLGDPKDYVDDEDEEETSSQDKQTYSQKAASSGEKRLFRDEENSVIAGVCAGIANYFNIDVVLVRSIFVVIFLFGGFGIPLYIVLWIVVPKAKNTIDRLRMKGQPITVENVKSEVENAAEKIKGESSRLIRKMRQKNMRHNVSRGARILGSIVGIGLIAFGLFHLIAFLVIILSGLQFIPIQSDQGFISFVELGDLVLSNSSDYSLAWTGGLLALFSIILFFILLGSLLLFRIRNLWSKVSLAVLFIAGTTGVIICLVVGSRTARDFVSEGEIEKTIGSIATSELVILPQLKSSSEEGNYQIKSEGRNGLMLIENNKIHLHGIRFEFVPSRDSLFHIKQSFSAHSHAHKSAIAKCKNMNHGVHLSNDSLWVDTYYTFPKEDKLRDQEVRIIVEVPAHGHVVAKDRIIHLNDEEEDDDEDEHTRKKYHLHESGYLFGDGDYDHWD